MDFTTIIWAVVVLGALAIVFGLILAVAAKVFEVEVDPACRRSRPVWPALTAAAAAIPAAPAAPRPFWPARLPVTACAPAGAEGAAKIAAIMGMEAPSGEKMVAHVLCNGGTNAVKNFEYRGSRTVWPPPRSAAATLWPASTAVWASAPAWPPASLMRSTSVPTALPWWIRRSAPTAAPAVRPVPGSSLWRSPIPRRYSSTAPTRIRVPPSPRSVPTPHRLRYVPAHL